MTAARRRLLARLYDAGIRAVEPAALVRAHLRSGPGGLRVVSGSRTVARLTGAVRIVAAGKAAAAMTAEAARIAGRAIVAGVAACPDGGPSPHPRIAVHRAGHPLPDRGSLAAGRAAWRIASGASAGEALVVLLSGGASSLLELPVPGVGLADLRRTADLLLRSGATIAETNAVRTRLSRIKGGGLAARAAPARVVALVLSDVVGNAPHVIGSGPAARPPAGASDARRVVERLGLGERLPAAVRRALAVEAAHGRERRAPHVVVGDFRRALAAIAEQARAAGFAPEILPAPLRGDTEAAALRFSRRLAALAATPGRHCLLAGGETTVRVTGPGHGGRNQHFALTLVEPLAGLRGVSCLSAGSDGRDGPTTAAGAFVDGGSAERARRRRLEPRAGLAACDSHGFFAALGDLFAPGATGTNVMDLKIALVDGRPAERVVEVAVAPGRRRGAGTGARK